MLDWIGLDWNTLFRVDKSVENNQINKCISVKTGKMCYYLFYWLLSFLQSEILFKNIFGKRLKISGGTFQRNDVISDCFNVTTSLLLFIKKAIITDSFDNVSSASVKRMLSGIKINQIFRFSISLDFPTFLETTVNKNLVIGNKVLNQCHSCNVQKNYLNKNLSGEMIDSENYRKKRDFNFWSDWVSPKIILVTLLSWIFFFDWKFIHMLLCR